MEPYKKEVIVDVPHRISGFFEIFDELNGNKLTDPIEIGSRGAGFNLCAVGKTKIQIEELGCEGDNEIEIFINDEKVDKKAETTYYLYNNLKNHIIKTMDYMTKILSCIFGLMKTVESTWQF